MNNKDLQPENDITRLSVPQVILLCLLTTTVASIATAIVVVQLTAKLPGDTVFQTIDRVTETVVEKAVPVEQTKTVVIKEGDLVAKAVSAVSGASEAIFSQTNSGEIISLTDGFKISDSRLVSGPVNDIVGSVSAGFAPVGYYGPDKIMLWEIIGDDTFSGASVDFVQGEPRVGQTMIYVGGDGKIIKGLVQSVSEVSIEFSENLAGQKTGLLLEVGGRVLGLWNGSEIIRSNVITGQIAELEKGTFTTSTNEIVIDNTQTNDETVTESEKKSGCELIGGSYNEFGECLGVNSAQCLVLGGEFNECASACRHDPAAEICTLQCVITCQL